MIGFEFPSLRVRRVIGGLGLLALPMAAHAFDLIPSFFEREQVNATIWELREQYVRLVRIEKRAPPNEHPVALEAIEVEQALSSLRLWVAGGILRDEEAVAVYPRKQAAQIARYVSEALVKAAPDEDVTFNLRSYADVMLSLAKGREWTTGRMFYREGKLNLIIGEYRKRLDKGKKNVEASFGIIDDFRDVHFQTGSRRSKGKMPGRIVTTEGVELHQNGKIRPDWVILDIEKAALAFRESRTPPAVRKEELKAKATAAKVTLERREMRQEMARMRKEFKEMQNTSGAVAFHSVEDRLEKLQQLLGKGLITDDDFNRRKEEILKEL
ncbi:MAG: SHOCT domain-containing protein [Gammaproteobacteria bacterium]|nr:SHOCT domain-containing protein [Gammaproteobacteria bacterium]